MRASLSLDLDNKWSYMKTHGDPAWQTRPSYLPIVVPRVLDLLDRLNARITFFIVGEDAAMPENGELLAELARRGHEIGNHSHRHEPWMHRHTRSDIDDELARAELSIERATGKRPRGFRGPGFTRSDAILEILIARGYLYDCSSLPTFIGPLARWYYFRNAKLTESARAEREDLFGRWQDGLRPNRRHMIDLSNGSICEIPVTTFPIVRTPIHVSYVLYLSAISPKLAQLYFRAALAACKLAGIEPSILLHPLDFLTKRECPELGFFPAMDMDPEIKEAVVNNSLSALASAFEVRPLEEFVAARTQNQATVTPSIAPAK